MEPQTVDDFIEYLTDLVDEYDMGSSPLLVRTEEGDVVGFAVSIDVFDGKPTIVFEEVQ